MGSSLTVIAASPAAPAVSVSSLAGRGVGWAARAFAWLMVVLVSLVVGCDRGTQSSVTGNPGNSAATGPTLFEDATAALGIDFVNDSGATGRYFMWEQMASGLALLDFDNDGRLDLYLVQCGGPESKSRNALYHQQSDGRFLDVSAGSGLDVAGYGMGAIAGDIDNDGLPDIVLTEYGATRLFLNRRRGKFAEVTSSAGIDNPHWAVGASFLDLDRDGWLDLVVVNYLDYDPSRECKDLAGAPEYCGPQDFPGTVTRLYRNRGRAANGEVSFEDISVSSGLARVIGPGLGVHCADFDGDRWPDIFVTDDGKPNRLFINQRNRTFLEEASQRGLAFNAMGAPAGNMGIAAGDVDGDGLFDVFVTHLANEQHALWKQNPRGLFQDRVVEAGLVNPRHRGTGFGAVLADFDLDGDLDLAFVNGRVLRGDDPAPRLARLHPHWHPYAQRYQLFLNQDGRHFQDISDSNPEYAGRAGVGRGLATGDLDEDGDLDLIATCTGGPMQVFRNIAPRLGHWITVRAIEPNLGGRDAIGAEVTVHAGDQRWWRVVQPSASFLASHDPRVHFGLGFVDRIDAIHVVWPEGSEEIFAGGPANQHLVVSKGTGWQATGAKSP